jgi:branched-chain amino acid transport system ATP-binding protein
MTILLVEQYVHRALALADDVAVLEKGRIAFAGDPREVAADELASRYLGVTS